MLVVIAVPILIVCLAIAFYAYSQIGSGGSLWDQAAKKEKWKRRDKQSKDSKE